MKIVAISDTHNLHGKLDLPDGDLLIHAGDFTNRGKETEVIYFAKWFEKQPHKYKIVIPGNHDTITAFKDFKEEFKGRGIILLEDEAVTIDGLLVYGSPWTPRYGMFEWMYERNSNDARKVWNNIPDNTDILITHGPAFGYGDMTQRGVNAGCEVLYDRIMEVMPKIHIFGHIHESFGVRDMNGVVSVNAAQHFALANDLTSPYPITLDIKRRGG